MRIDHRGEVFTAKAGENDWSEVELDLGKIVEGVPDTGFSRGFMSFAPKIINAILENNMRIDNAATFDDGMKVQRVLDAARESNASCRVIIINRN